MQAANLFARLEIPALSQLPKMQQFLEKLATLDLAHLFTALMASKTSICQQPYQVEMKIAYYLLFLCLRYLYPLEILVPTVTIDEVWHIHQELEQYNTDIQSLLPQPLNHDVPPESSVEQQKQADAFLHTRALIVQTFGIDFLANAVPAACRDLPAPAKRKSVFTTADRSYPV